MKNVNVMNDEQKLSVALVFARNPEVKVSEVAKQFAIGETSARRYRDQFAEQAIAVLKAEKDAEELKAAAEQQSATEDKAVMGYRPSNGRISFIRQAIVELGIAAKAAAIFERSNELAAKANVEPLNRSAFYVLKAEVIRRGVNFDKDHGARHNRAVNSKK